MKTITIKNGPKPYISEETKTKIANKKYTWTEYKITGDLTVFSDYKKWCKEVQKSEQLIDLSG